jgi:hypothetical protein
MDSAEFPPMQKVIPPRLLEPYLTGTRTVIAGFVYRVRDSVFAHPAHLHEALDLWYDGSQIPAEAPEVYVMRWLARDTDNYQVPYGAGLGGDWRQRPPFRGNGFTASRHHVVPEFFVEPIPIPAGAEIYRLTSAGEQFIAVYDGRTWTRVG